MPPSFPDGFTVMTNFRDRHTAESYYYFQKGASRAEVASSLSACGKRLEHRLPEGKIIRWHLDNDMAYDGPAVSSVAAELVERQSRGVGHEKNTNPTAERDLGVVEQAVKASLAHAGGDGCLWPWAVSQYEKIAYFISTDSHAPLSPFRFSHPQSNATDMTWAYPLFCDVTVHLPYRDRDGKLAATGADGCYLGWDERRDCAYCYLPTKRRIASFTVTTWRPNSFTACKGITADTPVEYHQVDDLRVGPATTELLPKQYRAGRAAEKEGAPPKTGKKEGARPAVSAEEAALLAKNATRIQAGIDQLVAAGSSAVTRAVIEDVRRSQVASSVTERALSAGTDALIYGGASADHHAETEIEINVNGNEIARKIATQYGIPKIRTVAEAMASQYWPLVKEAMEEEIAGKLANMAWKWYRAMSTEC